ncbi:annexin A7-like isoform X2 [Clavelina lepadiformis]|uniref:annexin A7-like isoform X2 n=1 Tax=Clavelina lepadiformis TaxID=159417 RepID=UPI004041297B
MAVQRRGTIFPSKDFDAAKAAQALWKAVDGIGTDETAIINIVSSCNNQQRQDIKQEFLKYYRKDLVKEFKSELQIRLAFDFKQLLISLFMTPAEFDANCLKASTKGLGTDEKTLVEVLLTKTADELSHVRTQYMQKFKTSLEDDVADDTSGDFRKFVYPLSRLTGETITTFIDREFSGDAASALKSAVKCAYCMPGFLAERLHKSMDGISTNDDTLIRIIVGRSEVDLADIKKEFEAKYNKSLESKIKSHTSRHFKQLLLAIVRGNADCEQKWE